MKWSVYKKYFEPLSIQDRGLVISHILFKTEVNAKLQRIAIEITQHGLISIEQGPYPFSEFWEDYDRKENRTQAEKLYAKTTAKEREKIKAHVPLYVKSREKQFRLKPDKYLRYKTWNDEIITPTAKTTKQPFTGNAKNDPERIFNMFKPKGSK